MIVRGDRVRNQLSAAHVEQRRGLGDRNRAGQLRIQRDVVVVDLVRARYLAAVQAQVDVVGRAFA